MKNYLLNKNGKVYIISGKLKGRRISFPNTSYLRPTTNRIRETLFQWLSYYIDNARCLDCFSGSGVLGIEAISRNAAFVTLLEINKNTIFKLQKNIKILNIKNIEVIHTNTFHWLKNTGVPYDIIFLDPPYHQNLITKTLFLLENQHWLKKNTLIYIEKEKNSFFSISKNWTLYKKKSISKIECFLYYYSL